MEAPHPKVSPLPFKLRRGDRAAIVSSVNGSLVQCHAALELAAAIVGGVCPHVSQPCRCDPRGVYLDALRHADEAYRDASDFHRFQQAARAQVYRGHCFRGLGEWRLAHQCYVRGASVRGPGWGAVDIEGLTRECQDRMDEEKEAEAAAARKRQGGTRRTVSFDPVEEPVVDGASAELLRRIADGILGGVGAGSSCWIRNQEGRIVAYRWRKPDLRRVESTPCLK